MSPHIQLRHLVFTGKGIEPAQLSFSEGLNIVYGASNTGKSFVVKALNFMFGGRDPLPSIDQRKPFNAVWLALTVDGVGDITLYRSTTGGAFRLHEGLVNPMTKGSAGMILGPKHDSKRKDTLSAYFLDKLGLNEKLLVKNKSGAKESLSFRHLAPYMFVSEESIIDERSPIYSRVVTKETVAKNVFKLLLTGDDDSAVVEVLPVAAQRVATSAKVELVKELISQIDEQLPEDIDGIELRIQKQKLDDLVRNFDENLAAIQLRIDNLVSLRRQANDEQQAITNRRADLGITLSRFKRLSDVYESDLRRLKAIEESSALLASMSSRPCSVCGAPPEAQTKSHSRAEIHNSLEAARAEILKINRDQHELQNTVSSLRAELNHLREYGTGLASRIENIEFELAELRPIESKSRQMYEAAQEQQFALSKKLDSLEKRDQLIYRKAELESIKPTGRTNSDLNIGVDGPTAFAFSQAVREVLEAWQFPDADRVQFDLSTQDLQIAGKPRAANGKGVRALLHAAFKIAVLVFCYRNNLPHPGILVLDTPLLTYREPLKSKHGALSNDEVELSKLGLPEKFYSYLHSLKGFGQVLVIENADPPSLVAGFADIQLFTGEIDNGRFGLFPVMRSK